MSETSEKIPMQIKIFMSKIQCRPLPNSILEDIIYFGDGVKRPHSAGELENIFDCLIPQKK